MRGIYIWHVLISVLNASYLGKNGAISHLFKVLSNLNKKSAVITRTVLETLVMLVKSSESSV